MSLMINLNPDQEQRGVKKFLEGMMQLTPVQVALRKLDQGASLSQVAYSLQQELIAVFEDQQRHTESLERAVSHEQQQVALLRKIVDGYYAHPLEQRIKDATKARSRVEMELQDIQNLLRAVREQSERERSAHLQELNTLRTQVQDLNRLVAMQHRKLEHLMGSGSPE